MCTKKYNFTRITANGDYTYYPNKVPDKVIRQLYDYDIVYDWKNPIITKYLEKHGFNKGCRLFIRRVEQ